MLGLEYFTFEELWSPMFFFFMAAIGILYFYMIGPWREKHAPEADAATRAQKLQFLSAAVIFYLAHGGPLSLLGHLMFSFHMINMALSYLIVPPLLLMSVPAFVWKRMFAARFWRKLRLLMNPIFTLVFFNLIFSIYHVPVVHDFVMTNFTIHRIYYFVLLVTACMMWWQIVDPVREWSRLTHVKKMAYVFANGALLTPACALIIFTSTPLYAMYNDPNVWIQAMGYCIPADRAYMLSEFEGGAKFFSLVSPVEDQQIGGIVMKLVQEVMYGIILAFIFRQWFKREHGENAEDDLTNTGTTGTA